MILDAVKQAIRAYWEGVEPEKLDKETTGRRKYNKKFFDSYEEKNFNSKTDAEEWL